MTPAEYVETIARLGMSQIESAEFLGVNARTARRWVAGDSEIPRAVEILIAYMDCAGKTPNDILRTCSPALGFPTIPDSAKGRRRAS